MKDTERETEAETEAEGDDRDRDRGRDRDKKYIWRERESIETVKRSGVAGEIHEQSIAEFYDSEIILDHSNGYGISCLWQNP